ncbi:MAG: hypothetical protein K0Q79_1150 [Flavipsychrobacter sp.]|jgi:hypothetical protein|nr:hypothetical protein [Flavipsychrobacter sp.]
MRSVFLALVILHACIINCLSQPLAAYVDIQNQLMVWNRGYIHKMDFLAPTSMKIGRTAIPYLDNSRTFKIYYNGGVKQMNIGFTNAFYVTDNLVAFLNQKSLNVFDKGNVKNLTGLCDEFFVADSIVLYLDGLKQEYRAYYNGQTIQLETFMPDSTLSQLKISDNIIAYDNFANLFKIFYRGTLLQQEDYPVKNFEVGRNTVAYVDIDRKFKIFHSGQTFIIDDYPPQSYKAGDNLVAFVGSDGYFKVFYSDSVRTIGYMNPTYEVADNIIAYRDPGGMFKVFYKGTITDLENYYPNNFTVQYNSVAYINAANTLRLFTEGEVYDVTNAELSNWSLNYDVITYQIGQGIFRVFHKGMEY